MENALLETMKEKIASVTTTALIKSYVGISMVLSVKKKSRAKKRQNNFEIRRTTNISKLNTTATSADSN